MVKRFLRSNRGFTLIELLVVIAILGVLAAVAIPNIVSLIKDGKLAAARGEAATVQTASDAYYTKYSKPAPDATALLDDGLLRGSIVGKYTITQAGNNAGLVVGTNYGTEGFVWGVPQENTWNK